MKLRTGAHACTGVVAAPLWAIALALAGCSPAPPAGYPGYVEGEYVRVASPLAGTLVSLAVERGAQVGANEPLFTLESAQERAAGDEARARVRQAQATLENLGKARRPPEIAAARAQLAQVQASLRQSEADLARTRKLVQDRFLSPQKLDEAQAARDRDNARVAELAAQLRVANLPARSDEIAAAQAEVNAAGDALAQAQWRIDQKSQRAPVAGLVADTLYRPGEWVAAGAPVVSRSRRSSPTGGTRCATFPTGIVIFAPRIARSRCRGRRRRSSFAVSTCRPRMRRSIRCWRAHSSIQTRSFAPRRRRAPTIVEDSARSGARESLGIGQSSWPRSRTRLDCPACASCSLPISTGARRA